MSKKYGLVLRGKDDQHLTIRKSNIFDEDAALESDSSEEMVSSKIKQVGPSKPDFLQAPKAHKVTDRFGSGKLKKETKGRIEKALEEDPNAFAYDEVYEEMKEDKQKIKGSKVRGESKYIANLIKSAEARKIEEQRRTDRKIEKERQEEGDEFDDKETFVTEAYKQKLMERKIFEEKERREKQLEELMDVKKQADMGGFYKHLLNQTTGEEKITESTSDKLLEKITEDLQRKRQAEQENQAHNLKFKKRSEKNIRKRREEDEGEEEEEEQTVILQRSKSAKVDKVEERAKSPEQVQTTEEEETKEVKEEEKIKEESDQPKEEPKVIPRRTLREILHDIFEKKTVGQNLEEAKRRYLERKAGQMVV